MKRIAKGRAGRRPRQIGETETRADFADSVYQKLGGKLSHEDVDTFLAAVLDTIEDCIVAGKRIEFRNFGVFDVVRRNARVTHNPNNPDELLNVPAHSTIKFKPSKSLQDRLNSKEK